MSGWEVQVQLGGNKPVPWLSWAALRWAQLPLTPGRLATSQPASQAQSQAAGSRALASLQAACRAGLRTRRCAPFKGIEAPPAPPHLGHAQPGWVQTCGVQRWSCSAPHGSSGP